ncbi:hypothetical protein LSH36_944g00007 [Paralvinella palmiformis]|uniref:Uncharacterized protein n=1 Tax=Paralvinella palmiformis TaxID=53620 RepID=A0AAD9MQS9_9ANNE|nr:hypothetical protein LSH36_944g00007 [Paralvinella palmiformis]
MHSDYFSLDYLGIVESFCFESEHRIRLPEYHNSINLSRYAIDGHNVGVVLFIKESLSYKRW